MMSFEAVKHWKTLISLTIMKNLHFNTYNKSVSVEQVSFQLNLCVYMCVKISFLKFQGN